MTRTALIALAAVAVIGTASLAPIAAEAKVPNGQVTQIKHFWPKKKGVHWPLWPRRVIKIVTVTTPVIVRSGVTYAAAPRASTCACLTKEYLPNGSVLFKDLCTKEMAISPAR